MGILYGQLEVHLKLNLTDEEVKDAKRTLANIIRKFGFHHPYTVKSVEYYPSVLARHFYEQGDTLMSKFPDNEFQCREGSLGCFVRGSDGLLYAITCAHVVDPHEKEEHDVYTTKRSERCKLGVSSRRMMMYGTELEEGMHLVDFAAIRVLRDEEDSCSCTLKDESGNDKRARVETEFSKDLIGTFVYKYGAETELTKGMIAANKYSFTGQTSSEHLLIIDSLPDICDNLNGMFSSKDSCSIENSQMSNATNVPTAMDDVDFVDLLQLDTNDCAVSSDNSFDTQDHPPLQSTHYGESTDPQKCRVSSKIQNIQARPESMDMCDGRDSEMFLSRNTHEIQDSPLSDNLSTMLPTGPFAQKGDGGSIVCRRDLKNDVIVAISMIVAGDFTFKDYVPVKTESDNRKCVSVRLDRTLTKLTERCGVEFTID